MSLKSEFVHIEIFSSALGLLGAAGAAKNSFGGNSIGGGQGFGGSQGFGGNQGFGFPNKFPFSLGSGLQLKPQYGSNYQYG